MAGMPQRRARRLGNLLENAVMPTLPDNWHAKSIAERLEANLGLSIDRCHQILNLPLETATPGQMSAIKEVALAHLNAGFRFMFTRAKDDARSQALEELALKLQARAE